MKVYAHLYSYPPLRLLGGEMMTSMLLSALAERGHEVKVATIAPCEPFVRGGVGVSPYLVDLLSTRETAPDVFITHPELAEVSYWRAAGYGSRMVAIVHNLEERTLRGLSEYGWDVVVANSVETQSALAAEGIESIVLRPPTRYLPPPRARLPRRFITLVNLSAAKGGHLFWELAERMPDHDFLGILGGYGGQIIHEGRPNVTITSSTDGMGLMLALTRALIMPSEKETWGMVGCEALVAGVPVLASDLPGTREALGDGARFLPHDDVDAWEDALRHFDNQAGYEWSVLQARIRGDELLAQSAESMREWVGIVEAL